MTGSNSTDNQVKHFLTASGAQIFQIAIKQFPILSGFVYFVLANQGETDEYRVLIDVGSGFGDCNQQIEAGLEHITHAFGVDASLENLTHILITHGHIDHFGGLAYFRARTSAKIGIHELDQRNLTLYEERLVVVSKRLEEFLIEAGVPEEKRAWIINIYKSTKGLFHSVPIDFTYESIGMQLGPFKMLHVPGHCAGQVVIRLDDILFSGDQVLSQISPHQSPEHLTLFTGLEHYLKSLDLLQSWQAGIRLTLAGHQEPILDLPARIAEIREIHRTRLGAVLSLLNQPMTIQEMSHQLFGEVSGYNVLLALEETGAHVEYLYQRGFLGIKNLEELENSNGPIPVRYYSLKDSSQMGSVRVEFPTGLNAGL